ncbi:hypothetical protein GGH93_002789 [Coemansia aciculifera]|nr:hypothetical protein GGH93_002789 [Coemansia aciculifera]
MTPWDAIALINFLPLLSDLHAPCPMVGTLDDDPALADIPTYVLAKYTSTGSRFRCWHFEHPMHDYFIEAVKAMLILALVCPNFDCFVPLPKEREPIMKLLEETIATDGFEKYAPRWRRFLISR